VSYKGSYKCTWYLAVLLVLSCCSCCFVTCYEQVNDHNNDDDDYIYYFQEILPLYDETLLVKLVCIVIQNFDVSHILSLRGV